MYELWISTKSIVQWLIGSIFVFSLAIVYFCLSFVLKFERLEWIIVLICKGMVFIAGFKLEVLGREHIKDNKTYLVVFNHINILDHFVLYDVVGHIMRGVEKASHFKWPIYGPFLKRCKQIPIEVGKGPIAAKRSLKKAEDIFRSGIFVAVAPEGTRSPSGKLMPFKKGAFHLAVDLQADIVPVVFEGMEKINLKTSYKIYPGKVRLNILEPIVCKGKTKKDVTQLRDDCYARFVEVLGKDKVL